jgi:hypothetical protein
MDGNLSNRPLAVILLAAFLAANAPVWGADEGAPATGGGTTPAGNAGGGGTAGVKEEEGVKATKTAAGEYEFEDTIIEGRLEKPVALFIKRQQPEFKSVRFARDFWDDILRPIDKEEFEKQYKESRFDYVKNPLLWLAVATAVSAGSAAGYQAYNKETGQVKVYGITAGTAAVAAGVLVLIDRSRNRGAR